MKMIEWSKIIKANRAAIEDKIIEAYKQAEGYENSWHFDVEIDENGKVDIGGPLSQGSQSGESWNGETCIVASIKGWRAEVDFLENVNQDEKLKAEYEASDYNTAEDFMEEKYPELKAEWENDYMEAEIQAFADSIDKLVDDAIEDQERNEAYNEEKEAFETDEFYR